MSAADQIHVYSARDSSFHATVRNPVSASSGKPSVILFGAVDTEVLVCSAFGLKLAIFDLRASKAVEVTNPKFHSPLSFSRGYSIHPTTGHLALLTRAVGKDMVSIHHPQSRQVQRSWYADTQDAQALMWTPDGRWLLLWESPAYGRRMLLYTSDGQLLRSLESSNLSQGDDAELEPGIKLCHISPDMALCAVCDNSRNVALLATDSWRSRMRLVHPGTIVPKDTLQVCNDASC